MNEKCILIEMSKPPKKSGWLEEEFHALYAIHHGNDKIAQISRLILEIHNKWE